jgi:UDP-3-O-[3-hydroxymyristoyl] glucosamine N-acyltransferase
MTAVALKDPIGFFELLSFIEELNVHSKLNTPNQFEINGISDGRSPVSHTICFLEDISLVKQDPTVLYILPDHIDGLATLVTDDPRYVLIKFLEHVQEYDNYEPLQDGFRDFVHATAFVHEKAVLESGVFIGENAWIGAGAVIKKGSVIGKNSIVRENTVIGCPGIALYKAKNGEVLRFPHLSGVTIGNNVEIGANAVIVQGTLKPTVIEDDVVVGNLCNIGHGVTVKSKVWMSVGTLIGGNCVVEKNATLGLGVSVKDRLHIEENTSVGMGSVVTKSTEENTSYFGNPAKPLRGLKTGPTR